MKRSWDVGQHDGVPPHGRPGAPDPGGVISRGLSPLLALADQVAASRSSLLVLGETGVGKEWLARRIHRASPRAKMPFVAVNCAAIPEGLAESELFGHVRGAFTGAIRARRGHFEAANGGTLFLDEVGDLPPAVQVRLLRVLQDGSYHPVGSESTLRTDVRVVAATHHRLAEAVERGEFRKDLYYRLAVVTLDVPPLRERREDILPLAEYYVEYFARCMGRPVPELSPEAAAALVDHDWPGNVRELMNVVERALLLGRSPSLGVEALPEAVLRAETVSGPGSGPARPRRLTSFNVARAQAIEAFEREYLTDLLSAARGRVGEAARRGGMSQRALYDRMRKYGLRKEDFRRSGGA